MTFAFLQTLSRLFRFAENVKCRQIFQEFISWGPYSNSEGERKIRRRLVTSPTKRAIRHFHVVVVQWQQRNVQKSSSRCRRRRRRRCLGSLIGKKDSNEKSGRLLCSLQVNYVFFLSGPECNSYVFLKHASKGKLKAHQVFGRKSNKRNSVSFGRTFAS